MRKKSQAIKVRIEPLTKLALQEVAARKRLDLSDIARIALDDYLRREAVPALSAVAYG